MKNSLVGLELLEKIGRDMDKGVYPVVHDRGIVEPDQFCGRLMESGKKEIPHGRENSRGPAAGQGERPPGRQGSTGRPATEGPGSPGSVSSILSELRLSRGAEADVEGVVGAYPQVELRPAPDVLWLLIWVAPVHAFEERALLATAYPLDERYDPVSWGWWGPQLFWIGPRHTNYDPAGSICSFEPSDKTWRRGFPLITLIDLQVLWILRHLFMRRFGWWPGEQFFHTAWERLNENRPQELCGGCNSGQKYENCCRSVDEAVEPVECLVKFMVKVDRKWERKPPTIVKEFVYGLRKTPPSLSDVCLHPRIWS